MSCRIVSVSPAPPKTTSWCATRPGQPHGVDRRIGPHALRGRLRGAGGRVALRLGVQLDDLRAREHLRRLLGEAHHQRCSEREVRCVEARHACLAGRRVDRIDVESARSDHDGDALREAGVDVRLDRVGSREVDRDVATTRPRPPRVDRLVPCGAQRRLEERPDLSGCAVQRDAHQAAFSSSAGFTRWTASANRDSSGPIPATERRSGASSASASSATSSRRHGLEALHDLLGREERRVRDRRLAEPRHPRRGRLERQQDAALEVLLRACELVRPHVSARDVRDLGDRDLEALGDVVLARAHIDTDLSGVVRTARSSCRPSTPSRASRGSPGTAATTRSRRRSRP